MRNYLLVSLSNGHFEFLFFTVPYAVLRHCSDFAAVMSAHIQIACVPALNAAIRNGTNVVAKLHSPVLCAQVGMATEPTTRLGGTLR